MAGGPLPRSGGTAALVTEKRCYLTSAFSIFWMVLEDYMSRQRNPKYVPDLSGCRQRSLNFPKHQRLHVSSLLPFIRSVSILVNLYFCPQLSCTPLSLGFFILSTPKQSLVNCDLRFSYLILNTTCNFQSQMIRWSWKPKRLAPQTDRQLFTSTE